MSVHFKGRSFLFRLRFALQGLGFALTHERSFRAQSLAAVMVLISLLVIRPPLIWGALVMAMVGLVLAAELFNTALEQILDGLHPQPADFVQSAKDCAAAAVLMLSCAAVVVYGLMLRAVGFD
ncbi:diacylglycerol kinase [Ferrovum myxofaciens]|uniref:diacylglycerol kinase n=1 Tax=Ferrovum myxofaciens TaxID=416213 RepID=UPI003EBCD552